MESQDRNEQAPVSQENATYSQPSPTPVPQPVPAPVQTAPVYYTPIPPQNPYPNQFNPPVPVTQPLMKKNFFTLHWLPITLGALLAVVSGFAIYQAYFANLFHSQYTEANTLYLAEVDKSAALEGKLTELNVDKEELEAIKNDLQNENQQLDEKATTAQQEAAKLQGSLAAKTEELTKKQAELEGINKSLASKKAELEKAQRGVSKFTEVEKLYASFKAKSDAFVGYSGDIIAYLLDFMDTGEEKYIYAAQDALDSADATLDEMDRLNAQMTTIFDQIKAGNY